MQTNVSPKLKRKPSLRYCRGNYEDTARSLLETAARSTWAVSSAVLPVLIINEMTAYYSMWIITR